MIMAKYEMMYIVKPSGEEKVNATTAKVLGVLEKYGAEVQKNDAWGEKALAYEIAGYNRGCYYLTSFDLKERKIKQIHQEINYIEDVLRLMIIVKDN